MSMAKRAKQKAAFGLDMDPDEFLERAIRTKPSEVEELIKRDKKRNILIRCATHKS